MNTKYCPSCGASNQHALEPPKFCSKCGKSLTAFFQDKTAALPLDAGKFEATSSNKPNLTKEQKDFISQNHKDMSLLDLTRFIFDNNSLVILSAEAKSVFNFIKTLGKNDDDGEDQNDETQRSSVEAMAHSLRGTVMVSEPPAFRIPINDVPRHSELGSRVGAPTPLPDYSN